MSVCCVIADCRFLCLSAQHDLFECGTHARRRVQKTVIRVHPQCISDTEANGLLDKHMFRRQELSYLPPETVDTVTLRSSINDGKFSASELNVQAAAIAAETPPPENASPIIGLMES